MKRLPVVLLIFTLAVLLLTCVQWFGNSAGAQRRRSARISAPQARRNPVIDYSKFSHATTQHQGDCNSCHLAPTSNWKKVSEIPDVADYPDHESCVRCHRQQFFRTAKPLICSVCHTKTSPRDEVRLNFPNRNLSQEFKVVFPHDRHQDVIASLLSRPMRNDDIKEAAYIQATLVARSPDDKTKSYNNCSICHIANANTLNQPTGGWIDGYVPLADTFMGAPEGHASCFSCHWARQEPVRNNCAGCHITAGTPYFALALPKRISIKFRHEGGGEKKNHIAECTTCHINITRVTTLEALKPDVPITSCSECHNKDGLRQDLSTELVAIDKNKNFKCSYCHTSNVGKLDPPPSHTIVAGRPQLKREELR
jgi:hypothetical protein